MLGMGASSRPNFNLQNHEEAEEYLVEWFENWRFAMNDMKDFILAGHSFGGYVCALYACKYHSYVKKLLLLSPAGVPRKSPDHNDV